MITTTTTVEHPTLNLVIAGGLGLDGAGDDGLGLGVGLGRVGGLAVLDDVAAGQLDLARQPQLVVEVEGEEDEAGDGGGPGGDDQQPHQLGPDLMHRRHARLRVEHAARPDHEGCGQHARHTACTRRHE